MSRQLLVLFGLVAPLLADGLIPPLTPAQVKEAKAAITAFKTNPRGPFFTVQWYCKDGSVLPGAGTPCTAKGGGIQHAENGPLAKRLNEWNLRAGMVLAALNYEQLLDAKLDHHRLKELVLHKYLFEVDQGWIYRRAVAMRGAWQIEDEEAAGRRFLVQLFADRQWILRNYYLANQLVATIPHGVNDLRVRRIRNLAAAVGNDLAAFQPVRAKIHNYPSRDDIGQVKQFLSANATTLSEANKTRLAELLKLLTDHYSSSQWVPALRAAQQKFPGTQVQRAIEGLIDALGSGNDDTLLEAASTLSLTIREEVERSPDGKKNLDLLDLNAVIHEKALEVRKPVGEVTRDRMLVRVLALSRMATGAGLLSKRQFGAVRQEVENLRRQDSIPAPAYRSSVRYLGSAAQWCQATASRDFGPVVTHYQAVEPLAKPLVDHLLRSSPALPLSQQLDRLLADADLAVGIRHSLFGQVSTAGVVGLNPGVAVGKLGILDEPAIEKGEMDPRGIYVIPQTAADLKPMAGILTLDGGNLLSHAQLLAANLGIPNAVIPSSLRASIQRREGTEIFYAVTPRNVVILKERAKLTPEEQKLFTHAQPGGPRRRITLDTSRLRLEDTKLRRLAELGSRDSGVIVGPKAANLGQLSSYFPNEVAPGFAIPFGIFQAHIARDLDGSGKTLERQIVEAVTHAESLRDQNAEPATINAYIYPKLAHFRKLIQSMPVIAGFQQAIVAEMKKEFGEDGSYGVFVRSDTNAEDLPEFTGAGLNLTLPNVVGERNVLQAIKNVWASPFTERAYDWRSRAIKGTERVYPSVIVMRAVPSDKSGVIATADLETGDATAITVNASEGVSAVVDGGVAESLLLTRDGGVRLLEQCRATYRKTLKLSGGFENLPALGGDALLTPEEIAQVRKLVAEVKAKYPAVKGDSGAVLPWDIEFGFERGALRLFQIRPLVRFQEIATLEALSKLEGPAQPAGVVRLSGKLL